MDGIIRTPLHRHILSFSDVKDKPIDRTHFFKSKTRFISSYISKALNQLYSGIWSAFAFDHVDMNDFKKAMLPVISSGAMILMGNYTTNKISQYYHETEDYEFFYKFLLAFAILSFSALNRVTDKKIKNTAGFSLAVASEVMAISYLYYSSYQTTQFLLKDNLSDNYALIASLGVSGFLIPGSIAHTAKKIQNQLVKEEYAKGAQRSDTALFSSGLTPISNTFFLAHYLFSQMNVSHLFQLTSIAYAIVNDKGLPKKFRDMPSFGMDKLPGMMAEIMKQQDNLDRDYKHNTSKHRTLRMTKNGPVFFHVPRCELRYGDYVLCDESMDLSSMRVSGNLVALEEQIEKLHLFPSVVPKKMSTNLIALTGENKWIQGETHHVISSSKTVDMHAVRDGKQAGVLVGSKLNVYGEKNFYIQIMPELERITTQGYQKKSVIADVILQHRKKTVISAILLSIFMGGMISHSDMNQMPENTLRFLFHVFQMMIPFSGGLLTKVVTNQLMKKMISRLDEDPLSMEQVLCNVDLCNAMAGYYKDIFQNGVVFVSDKTGTLTTTEMKLVRIWRSKQSQRYNPSISQAELFAWIFTNQEKEFEPEEFAMKEHFVAELNYPDFLQIEMRGSNHLVKKIRIHDEENQVETWHLGLYLKAGGRLTLVERNGDKYLAFCGIPNAETFESTSLLADYSEMEVRKGVLSRDWCIAHAPITDKQFLQLKKWFEQNDKESINAIENFVLNSKNIVVLFNHDLTCCINNPVKPDAEKIIERLRRIKVPFVIATGDSFKACLNINDILCPSNAGNALVINPKNMSVLDRVTLSSNMTIIFVGINDEILARYKQLLLGKAEDCPVVIYSQMSTEGKGVLVDFLKKNHFFVAYNGDGPNDTRGMEKANMVIGHTTSKGTCAPGIEQYVDLNDRQLQKLLQSDKSFYELFDIYEPQSAYVEIFAETANSLEKSDIALNIKGGFKMSFEFVKSMGWSVASMPYFHPASILFDVIYFTVATKEMIESADRPMDNKHLCASDFPLKLQLATLAFAVLQSFAMYTFTGETTNIYCMATMLAFLPFILKSIFSAFGHVQEEKGHRRLNEAGGSGGYNPRMFHENPSEGRHERQEVAPATLRCRSAPFPGRISLT